MNPNTIKVETTRNMILALLTDAEVANVSGDEGNHSLARGEEFVDLACPATGIQRVASDQTIESKTAIARTSVSEATWARIAETLGPTSTDQITASVKNTTDATRGQPLGARVETRKKELEAALATLALNDRDRPTIQLALDEITGLLTGNLDQIPRVVAVELNTWLEANKHVHERTT